jgi:hypothetical protein
VNRRERRRRRVVETRTAATKFEPAADQLYQQCAALQAAALGLLLAGLTADGARVGIETDRILKAPTNVAGGVLGFMTAHASEAFVHKHGTREATIAEVSSELNAMTLRANGSGK